jgi:hypothetical protein
MWAAPGDDGSKERETTGCTREGIGIMERAMP